MAGLDDLREQQDADLRMTLAELLREPCALVGLRRRHADVEHGDVRLELVDPAAKLVRVACLRDDVEPTFRGHPRQPFAEEHGVVGDHDPHVISARTCVPPPAAVSIVS